MGLDREIAQNKAVNFSLPLNGHWKPPVLYWLASQNCRQDIGPLGNFAYRDEEWDVFPLSSDLAKKYRILKIDRQQFEETVRTLNNLYAEAEKLGGQSYLEGCLACLTAYTIFLCMETHYEKVLKKVSKYIQEQNEKIYAPQGLLLTDPIERGLRVIEITIYEDRGMSSGR
uniref:Golgin subfamily A member 7 n=1 Tax=Equus asinus TaxID=9793 RepID=A0A9L0J3L7_EQUAS